jgi:hypothetical protein
MLFFFILGYLVLSGLLVLGLLWASRRGDSRYIRLAPDDTPPTPEHHPTGLAAHSSGQAADLSKEELIADL